MGGYGAVSGADTNPATCTADGEGLKVAFVGQPAPFVVHAYDWEAQPRTVGGDLVQVLLIPGHSTDIDGNGVVSGNVEDQGDGSYSCFFIPATKVGSWRLEIRVNGAQILGSPFLPNIENLEVAASGLPGGQTSSRGMKKRHSSSAVALDAPPAPSSAADGLAAPSEFLSAFSGDKDNDAASSVEEADDLVAEGVEHQANGSKDRAGLKTSGEWVALYDYVAQDADEVTLCKGDIVLDVAEVSPGWVTGTVDKSGAAGMIPSNYIEFLGDDEDGGENESRD